MKLEVNSEFSISDFAQGDQPALIEYLAEKQIYDQTLAIPYPYRQTEADWWIAYNIEKTKARNGRSTNWCIRRSEDGKLIGGVGYMDLAGEGARVSEIGYWLAKPYWNKNIMTLAVRKVAEYGFKEFGLERITATVFDFNLGSARVLEKAGFQFEGLLRSHYKKDGKVFDGKMYGLLPEDLER